MMRAASPATSVQRKPSSESLLVLQRKCACAATRDFAADCSGCRAEQLQMKRSPATRGAPTHLTASVERSLGGGVPLDPATRAFMEDRFGHDFGDVRVHAGGRAADSARAVDALAYTVGNDVVFGAGRYRPHTAPGLRLLAHELTHTLQQARSPSLSLAPHAISQPESRAEREADRASQLLFSSDRIGVGAHPDGLMHRAWDWGRAGLGSLIGGVAGGLLGLLAGPIGGLVGLGVGALLGGLIGGLTGEERVGAPQNLCDRAAEAIRRHPVYVALAAAAKRTADRIMTLARGRSRCLYFLEKLKLLLDTPEAPSGSVTERNRRRVSTAVDAERARLATPDARAEIGRQEAVAEDPARVWTRRRGRGGKIFLVDSSNPAQVVVRVKVRFVARGGSSPADVANLVFLEDAAELIAETHGYVVDMVFVEHDAEDVFTVGTDVSEWPTSGNIVGNARTIAHEVHHLLGLPDRYDYIESHAGNRNMLIPRRLHWFLVQMQRSPDPDADRSLMGSGNTMLDDDVCRVAGLDPTSCQAARQGRAP